MGTVVLKLRNTVECSRHRCDGSSELIKKRRRKVREDNRRESTSGVLGKRVNMITVLRGYRKETRSGVDDVVGAHGCLPARLQAVLVSVSFQGCGRRITVTGVELCGS